MSKSTSVPRLIKASQKNILPLFVLGSSLLNTIIFVQLCLNNIWVARLAKKPPPALVQLVDGRIIEVAPTDSLSRKPENIKRFVQETMTLMFSWSGNLTNGSEKLKSETLPDPGIRIKNSRNRITTPSWTASFALSEDFRAAFLAELAELTPQSIWRSNTAVFLQINRISEPEEIAPGKWKVKLVSNLMTFENSDPIGQGISFNKEIYLRAVTPSLSPLPKSASEYQKTAYRIREAGLEIYKITALSR
ncbi:MAG: hypothetical protein AB4368_00285 [Xenococcaceae cyanobacterium]